MHLFTTMKPINKQMQEKCITSIQTCETFAANEVLTVTTFNRGVAFNNACPLTSPLTDYHFLSMASSTHIGSTSPNVLGFNSKNFTSNHSQLITTVTESFEASTLCDVRNQDCQTLIFEGEKLRGNEQEKRCKKTKNNSTNVKSALRKAGDLSRNGLSVRWATSVPPIAPGDSPRKTPTNEQIRKSLHNAKFEYDVKKEIWLHCDTQTVVKTNNYGGEVLTVEASGICSSLVETFLSSSEWEPILFGKDLLEWVDAQVLSSTYLTKEMVSLYCCKVGCNGPCGSDSDTDSSDGSYSDTDSCSDYSSSESEDTFQQDDHVPLKKDESLLFTQEFPAKQGSQKTNDNCKSEINTAGVFDPVFIIWE